MVYFHDQTPFVARVEKIKGFDENSFMPRYRATITFEFTGYGQCDGHGPRHGDFTRDFVECMLQQWCDPRGPADTPPTPLVAELTKAYREAMGLPAKDEA